MTTETNTLQPLGSIGVLDADGDLTIIGIALVDLGKAMQDKNTTIDELAVLAFKAGLSLRIRICG